MKHPLYLPHLISCGKLHTPLKYVNQSYCLKCVMLWDTYISLRARASRLQEVRKKIPFAK